MKKKLRKDKKKRITDEQRERRRKNKEAQMAVRKALGFDKMKIRSRKFIEDNSNINPWETFIPLDTWQQCQLTTMSVSNKSKPLVIDWEEAR